jgi:L-amino acid N-acyltransferase YncA
LSQVVGDAECRQNLHAIRREAQSSTDAFDERIGFVKCAAEPRFLEKQRERWSCDAATYDEDAPASDRERS